MPKMSANVYVIEDYENETAFRPKKTNPIKPNFKRALFSAKIGNFFPKKLRKRGILKVLIFRNRASNSLTTLTGHVSTHSPQPVNLSRSTKLACFRTSILKLPAVHEIFSGSTSHLPSAEPPQGPLRSDFEHLVTGQTPPKIPSLQSPQAKQSFDFTQDGEPVEPFSDHWPAPSLVPQNIVLRAG